MNVYLIATLIVFMGLQGVFNFMVIKRFRKSDMAITF